MDWSATVTKLQTDINVLASTPIAYWPFNFVCSALTGAASFLLFGYFEYRKDRDIIEQMSFVTEQVKRITAPFIFFVLVYSIVTGLFSAALIHLKYKAADPVAAIFLAVFGPYTLRDKFLGQ